MFAGCNGHACDTTDLQSEHGACSTAVTQTAEHTRADSVVQSRFMALFEEHSLLKLNLEAPTAKFTMCGIVKNVALQLQKIGVSRVE